MGMNVGILISHNGAYIAFFPNEKQIHFIKGEEAHSQENHTHVVRDMGTQVIPQYGTKSSPKNMYPPPTPSLLKQWPTTFLISPLLAN